MAENIFTKKLGPLPVWGWMGIGTAGLLLLGQGSKGKKSQPATTPPPAPVNDTADPASAMGAVSGNGGTGGNQWTGGKNGQYGHTGAPGFGNGWTRPRGVLSSSPPMHSPRHSGRGTPGGHMGGHSGGWGGSMPGPGNHGIGGGSQGVGGIQHPHAGKK